MSTATVTWRGDQWAAAAVPALNKAVTAMAREGMLQAKAIIKPTGTKGPPSKPWNPPAGHHGNAGLQGSIDYGTPEQRGTPLRAAFGTSLAYGRHLEFGAFIRPKTKKFLFIPMNWAAQRLMVKHQQNGRACIAEMKARETKTLKLVYIRRKRGGTIVGFMQSAGRGKGERFLVGIGRSGAEPVFMLAKWAIIEPRPWLLRSALTGEEAIRDAGVRTAQRELRSAGLVAGAGSSLAGAAGGAP